MDPNFCSRSSRMRHLQWAASADPPRGPASSMASLLLVSRLSSRNATSLSRILINTVRCKESLHHPFIFSSSRTFASSPYNSIPKSNAAENLTGSSFDSNSESLMDLTHFLEIVPPEVVTVAAKATGHLTATDVGLTWWLPTGGVYNILDALSTSYPWWASIAILAVCARVLLLPVMIQNQKSAIEIKKLLPEQMAIQKDLSTAVKEENPQKIINILGRMQQFQGKQMYVMSRVPLRILVTAPVFISVFYALRAMAYYPVVSMKNGGLFWFTDLTVADPYYLLPLFIGTSLHLIFRSGMEFGNIDHPNIPPVLQNVMLYGMPGLTFVGLCIWGCPSALLYYFAVNNLLSLVQSLVLRQKSVKAYLKIPEIDTSNVKFEQNNFAQQVQTMEKAFRIARDYTAKRAAESARRPPEGEKPPKEE